ncbi:GGDEF domain-containing protein [Paenibacillus tarimensis]|uniref:GGDEF domain-containing protein n=1 Tax=Paenibacillus tarimensis TaxID=416012 RepID=UPI001F4605FC|nr:GGDEF domain-containing protein [Paenibacillus tarimensis]
MSITGAVLILTRLAFFPFATSSIVGVLIIAASVIAYVIIKRSNQSDLKKWVWMNVFGFLLNVIPLRLYIEGYDLLEIVIGYGLVTVSAGILVYIASNYIAESNRNHMLMKEQLERDFLTGLSNRRHFHTMFQGYLEKAVRNNQPLSFLMIDIDHFKSINDTYGHPVGDAVLQRLGKFLMESSRNEDLVSRMGGEEFSALLWNTSYEQATAIAERWRSQITHISMRMPSGKNITITVSIGVSSFPPHKEAVTLLEEADKALYRAKQQGRNRVC